MNSRRLFLIPVILLLAACGEKNPAEESRPAIKVELEEASAFWATFTVKAVNTANVMYWVNEGTPLNARTDGIGPTSLQLRVQDLEPLTTYTLFARGIGPSGEEGSLQSVVFSTLKGPDNLYSWETQRKVTPSFADISLVTMGWHNASPPAWTMDRFASHVSYTDASGTPHWLFDCFLCIDGWDGKRGLSYSLANSRYSAVKDSWQDLLDAWLGEEGALLLLDQAVDRAASLQLGAPPSKRYIIMSLPDPIRFQYFSDKNSSTKYWGDLSGRALDFASVEDQKAAYRWYMDSCRELFYRRRFKHLELAGFYILSEELPLKPDFFKNAGQSYAPGVDTINWEYKNWEELVPWVASYAHSCIEGLWWIPYNLAPGHIVWSELGFDCVFMQPNYYWDHDNISHPLSATENALKTYKMGIELEFEYSLVASVMADGRSGPDGNGSPTFYLKDVPMLRQRVRDYMDMYVRTGLYGQIPVAVYSGTDAWNQLATSTDPDDREMFLDICGFISQSSLKK